MGRIEKAEEYYTIILVKLSTTDTLQIVLII